MEIRDFFLNTSCAAERARIIRCQIGFSTLELGWTLAESVEPTEQAATISALEWRLNARHHLRSLFPRTCNLPDLSANELAFHCAARFYANIYINGWDGYQSNTENKFSEFTATALDTIGAHALAALARDALQREDVLASLSEEEIERRELKRPSSVPFFHCPDDLLSLLYQFWLEHKGEFPSAEPVTKLEANNFRLQREYLSQTERSALPRFVCPRCQQTYISETADRECVHCKLDRKLGLDSPST